MTLPHTEPLCTGTIIGSTDLYCKERHACQRYTEWQKWLNESNPARGITAFAAQPGCNKKIVVEEK